MGDQEKKPNETKLTAGAKFLQMAGEKLAPIFISATGLLGFVAFSGAVIMWTRLEAMEVPPEQALDIAPQGELVAIGASYLLVLGFFGALAAMAVFLTDRGARPTPGMARTLLVLVGLEGIATIAIIPDLSFATSAVDCLLLTIPLLAAFLATMVDGFSDLEDDLERIQREREGKSYRRHPGLLRWHRASEQNRATGPGTDRRPAFGGMERPAVVLMPIAIAIVALAVFGVLAAFGVSDEIRAWALAIFAVVLAVWLLCFAAHDRRSAVRCAPPAPTAQPPAQRSKRQAARRTGGLLGCFWRPAPAPATKGVDEQAEKDSSCDEPSGCKCEERRREREEEKLEADRRALERPRRLRLKPWGAALILAAMVFGGVLVLLRLDDIWGAEWWVPSSLALAPLLAVALWRISELANTRLVWFGVAVFLSVPLFGTLLTVAKNLADPQVQALALIRKADTPTESIQGLYVTEANDRVYFANLATEGCGEEIEPGSGRLLSLPSDDVVAMSLGPRQGITEARKTALEMSYALTPAIETGGASELLPDDEERQKKAEEEENVSLAGARLENAGPAIRPDFGSGLTLEPDSAEPGDEVTLTMSVPKREIGGFGQGRDGNNVRIGGVKADIAKQPALKIERAEFILVGEGSDDEEWIPLDKEGVFVDIGDPGEEFVPLDEVEAGDTEAGDSLYVKLDSAVRRIGNQSIPGDRARYLKVDAENVSVAEGARFDLADSSLYQQIWNENRITFIVPEEARTDVVTVECNQLAGSPLLRVAHDPVARIAVRMRPNSPMVTLDGRGSGDRDENDEVTMTWRVEGARHGHGKRIEATLPVRTSPYTVELKVIDKAGHTDTTEVSLLRLPASKFEFDGRRPIGEKVIASARRELENAARSGASPIAIELHGHADDPGTRRYNLKLSLARADEVRKRLFKKPRHSGGAAATSKQKEGERAVVPVRELAYGERCPLDRRGGRQPRNRRVDVFVLGEGVTIVPSDGCRPGRQKSANW